MKLLVDMNLSPRWIGLLTEAGVEAEHWSGIGALNAPDSEIMAYAFSNGYVVLTMILILARSSRRRMARSLASYKLERKMSAQT